MTPTQSTVSKPKGWKIIFWPFIISFNWLKTHSNTVTAITAIVAIFYTHFSTQKTLRLTAQTIEQAQEQIALQKKSLPSQFKMTYKEEDTYKEQAFVTNTGKTLLNQVSAEFKYYFILPDYTILTRYGIQKRLENDAVLLNTFRKNGILQFPSDLSSLLGLSRNFYLKELSPQDETLLEINPSTIQNAEKIAKILNAQVVTRWTIHYNEELSNKENISTLFIWMHDPNLDRLPIGRENSQRESLTSVLGGDKIIESISEFEKTTKEVIFGYQNDDKKTTANKSIAASGAGH